MSFSTLNAEIILEGPSSLACRMLMGEVSGIFNVLFSWIVIHEPSGEGVCEEPPGRERLGAELFSKKSQLCSTLNKE